MNEPSREDQGPVRSLQSHGERFLAAAGPAILASLGILLVTWLHYTTLPGLVRFHAIYRYFYFLPVVYAALRYGFWGGVLAAMAASLLFAPHIFFKWSGFPEESLNDLLVTAALIGVAIITGTTVDRMHEAERAQAETARHLARSLEKLRSQGEELRRAERLSALGTLAGGLAHEIRNPVSIIRATAQLLQAECGPETAESLAVIQQETDRIEQLVTELVHLATGHEPTPQWTDLQALLARVRERLAPLAQTHGVALQVDLPNTPSSAWVDPKRIEQVLVQLAMNAIQAMAEEQKGGTVTFQVRWEAQEPLPLVLEVHDTGPGIPSELRSRIFDPFFTTKDTGTGLGLAVVQRIVEDHGGRVQVRSTPGQGTTFTVRLPGADSPHPFSTSQPHHI